jgi:NHLM bacteriocin system secretion protein
MVNEPVTGMFRKEALEARGRTDALASTIQVTNTGMRSTLVALALVTVGAVAASAYVLVPIQITGNGVIIDHSGHSQASITPSASGIIEALLVRQGEHVVKGQPVARLSMPELANAIPRLRGTAEALAREDQAMARLARLDHESEGRIMALKAENLDSQIANLRRRIEWLWDRERAEAELLARGNSTEARLIKARLAAQDAQAQLDSMIADRRALDAAAQEAETRREREQLERLLKINQARLELETAERNLEGGRVMRSPVDGVVADLPGQVGTPIAPGQPVVIVTAESRVDDARMLEAAVYVPLAAGKQISRGDRVLLAPASLHENQHVRILARVKQVSGTASSREAVLAASGNERLAELVTRNGPVFQVVVELERDPRNLSGLSWTSGGEGRAAFTRGTPVDARITVEHASLISLALPALRGIVLREPPGWAGDKR